jgi:hypothetical protein
MKASESNTEVSFSWSKMHSRVGVTFPALILARLHLCRLVCYSDLSHVVLRPHYPCADMETTLDHFEKILGAGCREIRQIRKMDVTCTFLLPKDVLAR